MGYKKESGDDMSSPLDTDQDFTDSSLKASDEFWKKEDADFFALMEKFRGTDKSTT